MNDQEVIQDFRRRWENTFLWLYMEKTSEETLVKLTTVEDSREKVATLHLVSAKYGNFTLNFGSPDHELRFKYPPVGVFQSGMDACLFRRRPIRQYRRGICTDNSTLVNVTRNCVGTLVRLDFPTIVDAFGHHTYSLADACRLLGDGKCRSVALDHNFSVSLSLTTTSYDYILWHWDHPVAYLEKDGKVKLIMEKNYASWINEIK